jgi:hypothetical protein
MNNTLSTTRTRSATDRLNTILAVAEQMIGVQAGSSSQSSSSSKPAFLWVLRDMQLQMKQEPKAEMTGKLEDSQLRKLKRSFREYDCFPLPRPVDSESQLQVSQHSFPQHLYNIFYSYAVDVMRKLWSLSVPSLSLSLARARTLSLSLSLARSLSLSLSRNAGGGYHGVQLAQGQLCRGVLPA